MNFADIVVFAILGGSMYFGWKKGFIVAVIEFFKWIASLVIARLFHVRFTRFLISIFGDPSEKISGHVKTYLNDMLGFDGFIEEKLGAPQIENAMNTLKLPEQFEVSLRSNIAAKAVDTSTAFVEEATYQMSQMIINGLGFLLLVVILLTLFSFAQVIGNYLSKLPLIKELNNGGGLLLGALIGIVSVYFIMAMLDYLRALSFARQALESVEHSSYAIYFYKYNILQYMFNTMLFKGRVL
ncbi:MAG TPA: hypothetical protein DCS67_05040 [Clostridiales bacterium UBA8960]|nr:hypothetical protein [Clostridiales bacterium UBA8960]